MDTSNVYLGIRYPEPGYNPYNCPPPFIMPPRDEVLKRIGLDDACTAKSLFESAQVIEHIQGASTQRHCLVLGDKDEDSTSTYVGAYGNVANRSGRGISRSKVYKKTPQENAEVVNALAKSLEQIFRLYAHSKCVSIAEDAAEFVHHSTIEGCRIYSGLAIGTNIYLQAHVDRDFTQSIVMVLKNQRCKNEDDVAAYFCFPRLGVAVPLRPGDVLIFNPLEPHCLSSRCRKTDDIVCFSLYLKTAVTGKHDNSNPLTSREVQLLKHYQTDCMLDCSRHIRSNT